jgi:UDP-glucose-4-epimerase GalE
MPARRWLWPVIIHWFWIISKEVTVGLSNGDPWSKPICELKKIYVAHLKGGGLAPSCILPRMLTSAFDCRNFVLSSSCATYGIPDFLPLTEDHAQRPVNPYGYSKLVVEQMLKHAEAAHGIRHVALRYFNAAGADPEGELGEMHDPETHLVPLILFAAMGRYPSVQIFGTDYPTSDGSCIRDYVHVSDLADAHVAALDWLLGGKPSSSFNLGTGRGFSVREVIRTTEEIIGRPITTEICPRRAGDPPILISDASRARDQLGWKPRFPALAQQIEHAWKWVQDGMLKVPCS